MKKRILLPIALIMIMLSSCMRAGRFHELTLCGAYAVPGMFYSDLKGNTTSVTTLEEDNQGRILFEYTAPNVITGEMETVLVICQCIDTDYVYYYEDQCYLYHSDTEADIALLKAKNDWGLPLDWNKMSIRANNISFDLCINTDSILEPQEKDRTIRSELGNLGAILGKYQLLDVNPHGCELYWISATLNKEQVNYYAIINPDYVIALLSATDDAINSDEIAIFKQENGWFPVDS